MPPVRLFTVSSTRMTSGTGIQPVELLPLDLIKQRPEALPFGWINGLYESDAALQVGSEAGVCFAVLGFRTVADAIRQYRFEAVEVGSNDVHTLIRYQPRQILPDALPHDASLAVMHGETLFL
jgi:hypothetical protein